jgi:hypothetical protein
MIGGHHVTNVFHKHLASLDEQSSFTGADDILTEIKKEKISSLRGAGAARQALVHAIALKTT